MEGFGFRLRVCCCFGKPTTSLAVKKVRQTHLLFNEQPCASPSFQQDHVISSNQWAVSHTKPKQFRASMWSFSSSSRAKTIWKSQVKTAKSQNHEIGGDFRAIYYCMIVYPNSHRKYDWKKLCISVWSTHLGHLQGLAESSREIFQTFLRPSVLLYYFISHAFTGYYHSFSKVST